MEKATKLAIIFFSLYLLQLLVEGGIFLLIIYYKLSIPLALFLIIFIPISAWGLHYYVLFKKYLPWIFEEFEEATGKKLTFSAYFSSKELLKFCLYNSKRLPEFLRKQLFLTILFFAIAFILLILSFYF